MNLYFYVLSKSDSITNSRLAKDTFFTDFKYAILDANKYINDNELYDTRIYLNNLFSHFFVYFYEIAVNLNKINKNKDYLSLIKDMTIELINEKAIDKNILLDCLTMLTEEKGLIFWYRENIL